MKHTEPYPYLFRPNLHTVVWGGSRLAPWKKLSGWEGRPVGESWEVSAIPSSPSIIDNGPLAGQVLGDVIACQPEAILGQAVVEKYGPQLPLLVKFIDAERDLSIQVHPDDEMARREHQKRGKTEMWYIIDAKPGAFLYAGFKDRLTPDEYRRRVADGSIVSCLARHEVKTGDVFYLPAGRVHAICGGILLAEVQQSSDVTYRIYDYDRPGLDGRPRELHTDLAAQALDFTVYDDYRTDYLDRASAANHCVDSPHFSVRVVNAERPFHRNLLKYDSFIITMGIHGDCLLRMRSDGTELTLTEGHSCLIPACMADYDIVPLSGTVTLLDAYINNMRTDLTSVLSRFLHISEK